MTGMLVAVSDWEPPSSKASPFALSTSSLFTLPTPVGTDDEVERGNRVEDGGVSEFSEVPFVLASCCFSCAPSLKSTIYDNGKPKEPQKQKRLRSIVRDSEGNGQRSENSARTDDSMSTINSCYGWMKLPKNES